MHMHLKPHHPPSVKYNVEIVQGVIFNHIGKRVAVAIALIFNVLLFFYRQTSLPRVCNSWLFMAAVFNCRGTL